MSFSDRVRQLRKENRITQMQLAENIKVSDRTIKRYESAEIEPTMSVIIAIADFFNVSADYLLGRSDNHIPPIVQKIADKFGVSTDYLIELASAETSE